MNYQNSAEARRHEDVIEKPKSMFSERAVRVKLQSALGRLFFKAGSMAEAP